MQTLQALQTLQIFMWYVKEFAFLLEDNNFCDMSMCLIFKILQRTVTDFNMPFWKKWIVAHFEADNEYVSIKSDSRKLKINSGNIH